MKNQIGTVPKEKGFISTFRQHQGWWRTFVLNEPEGEYYYARKKEYKKVCNRINNGDVTLKNFLSPGIVDAVNNALKHQKQHKSGIIDKDRLYNNLLSSQPLAFNFFGFFKPDDKISLAFLQTIRPDITALEEIVFEYAPKTSSDNSAFDFGFIVRSDAGRGFIGLERIMEVVSFLFEQFREDFDEMVAERYGKELTEDQMNVERKLLVSMIAQNI